MGLRCKQCGSETNAKGALVINRHSVLAGAAYLVVPADGVELPQHFDLALCGKGCLMEYMSAEADAMLGIGRAVIFHKETPLKECPKCGSIMPANEGSVCIDCQEAGRVA